MAEQRSRAETIYRSLLGVRLRRSNELRAATPSAPLNGRHSQVDQMNRLVAWLLSQQLRANSRRRRLVEVVAVASSQAGRGGRAASSIIQALPELYTFLLVELQDSDRCSTTYHVCER